MKSSQAWLQNVHDLSNPVAHIITGAEFAIVADLNPGVGDGYDVTFPKETSSAGDMQKANSRNHQGTGQNVLYGDGHAEFQQNPFCGSKRDNI